MTPSLDELVPENHFVRTVSKTVDEQDIKKIFAQNTKGGGTSMTNRISKPRLQDNQQIPK
ncbi:MAG: hypothetical protein J6B32_00385 [Spirochaetaceae bacterium]|nr:hypothetical protein [Spirochaetaceae bacterium]